MLLDRAHFTYAAAATLLLTSIGLTDPVQKPAAGDAPVTLPAPTGPFAIGRVSVSWADTSRIEPLSADHAPRQLMVDVWYPAAPSVTARAEYIDGAGYEKALGAEGFQDFVRDASGAIRRGVQTQAIAGAPYAPSAGLSPLLIFSPGAG